MAPEGHRGSHEGGERWLGWGAGVRGSVSRALQAAVRGVDFA